MSICRASLEGHMQGELEPIPADIGGEAGQTLDRSPVHRRADGVKQSIPAHINTFGQYRVSNGPNHSLHVFGPIHPRSKGRTYKLHTERPCPAVNNLIQQYEINKSCKFSHSR